MRDRRKGWDYDRAYNENRMLFYSRLGWDSVKDLIVWQGTVTGLRISAVDGGAVESGGAFVDGLPTAIMDLIAANPAGTLQFSAYDSASRELRGVLKAAGSAETLSATNIYNNGDFATAEPAGIAWSRQTGWTVAGGLGVCNSAGAAAIYQNGTTVARGLFLQGYDIVGLTSGSFSQFSNYASLTDITNTSIGTRNWYYTAITMMVGVGPKTTVATVGTIDNAVLKQVLAPSASGATVVSLKSGTLFSWTVNQWVAASYNALTNYVIIRRLR